MHRLPAGVFPVSRTLKVSVVQRRHRVRKANVRHARRALPAVVKRQAAVAVIAVKPVAVSPQVARPTTPAPSAQPSPRRKSAQA
jgi:hypothetical protein